MKPTLSLLSSSQKNRYKTSQFRKPAGFSMVGVLVASTVGAMAVVGLSQLSTVVARKARRSQQMFNFILLSEEIKQTFKLGKPQPCNSSTQDCFNTCTSSLFDYSDSTPMAFAIRQPSVSGTGGILYEGGELYKDIKIQEIKFTPGPQVVPALPADEASVSIHFSLSDDTRETLVTPPSLNFHILLDDHTGGQIKECSLASASLAGSGPPGIPHGCRKVVLEQSLVGCGDTIDNKDLKGTAFGYRSGFQSLGEGNTFFGHEAGKDNITGKENTAVGYRAGYQTINNPAWPNPNESGSFNTFLGYEAGEDNKQGLHHIAIGTKTKVGGTAKRDKLNIGNLIEGTFLNKTPYPGHPASNKPEVIFKGPVKIEPPVTPASLLSAINPSLEIYGEVKVEKKEVPLITPPPNPPLDFTIKAEGSAANPEMQLMAHGIKIKKKSPPQNSVKLTVEGTDKDPGLKINADLKVQSSTPASSSQPGLEVRGKWNLKNRIGSLTVTAEATGGDPGLLKINKDLTVNGSGNPTDETESIFEENLDITQTLKVNTPPPPDYTAQFKDLIVNGSVDFTSTPVTSFAISNNANINEAEIDTRLTTSTASITTAQITDLNEDSHWHPHNHPRYQPPHSLHSGCACSPRCNCCGSSRTLKRNIKPFKSYEKSLEDILNTPLFTYQYKKDKGDYPEKVRMGIISEELPKDLQILDKDKPSTPDWISIYGTLWAGVKALAKRLQDATEESTKKLAELSQELKKYFSETITHFKEETASHITETRKHLIKLGKKFQKQKQQANQNSQKFSELKSQFQNTNLILENSEKELKNLQKELETARKEFKKILSRKKNKSVSKLEKKETRNDNEAVIPAKAGIQHIMTGPPPPRG